MQLACHKQANIHWSCFQRLDHPQGSTRYPFLLLFHIENNVQFKFGGGGGGGGGSVVNSKIHLLYLHACFSYLFSCNWCVLFLSFFLLFCVLYELGWCLVIVLRILCL